MGLASLGLVLPLLPTTPFLLLAAACFLRGSARMHRWLINHRVFGGYLRNYQRGQITRRDRWSTLILLWGGLTVSGVLMARWWAAVLLLLVAVGVTLHLCRLKTLEPGT